MENEKKTRRRSGHIEHWQIVAIFLGAYDFVAVCVSYFLALWLRFSFVTSQPSKNGLVLA